MTHISEAESQVMEVLWDNSPRSAEEVVAALAEQRDWQEATIKTLLNRLLKKGALSATKDGRRFLYSPCFSRADWAARASTSMIERLFGGKLAPLVAHFGQQGKLSKSDIADLKRLIGELDDDA